ncbi:MAG: uracil-DNA glycosylase [Bacteroidetes bacterium]|nr:uracil-DNA glycosylase [Bacteroidota bacterium]
MEHAKLGTWAEIFQSESLRQDLREIEDQLKAEALNYRIFPGSQFRFRALELCPLEKTQVVIVGQDPYHGDGQADGLAFSVPNGIAPPPSLRNIIQEILQDSIINPGGEAALHTLNLEGGNLESWAAQGVLLLNMTLSVRENQAGSHQHLPWSSITKAWIDLVNRKAQPVVFLLWGNHARQLKPLIQSKHLVLESAHPSPLSAYRGFIDSRPFGKANQWLTEHQRPGIDWLSPWRRSANPL